MNEKIIYYFNNNNTFVYSALFILRCFKVPEHVQLQTSVLRINKLK